MPQMAPINWFSLFLIFTISLILFNTMNYFFFNPLMPKLSLINKKLINKLNWKW